MKKFIKFIAMSVVLVLITALALGCGQSVEQSKDKAISFREYTEYKYEVAKNKEPEDYDAIFDFDLRYKMNGDTNYVIKNQIINEDGETETVEMGYDTKSIIENALSVKRIDNDVFFTLSMYKTESFSAPLSEEVAVVVTTLNIEKYYYQTAKDDVGYYAVKETYGENKSYSSFSCYSYNEIERFESREEYIEFVSSALIRYSLYAFDDVYIPDEATASFARSVDGVAINASKSECSWDKEMLYEEINTYNASYTPNGIYTKSKETTRSEYTDSKSIVEETVEIDMEYTSSYSPKTIDLINYSDGSVDVDISGFIAVEHYIA